MRAVRSDDVVVFDDAQTLARGVAERVIALATAAIRERNSFSLALAGGSTPKAAYAVLSAADMRQAVDWSRVRFFFGDERCVPPDNDDSNYKMARLALLEPLGIEPAAVFRMYGEADPREAARSYAACLTRELGHEPAPDLVMLGMGPDGHTASLFPGSDPLDGDDELVRAPWVAKLAAFRLTLTPRVLNNARNIIIATEGPTKADALEAVLEGPYRPTDLPIQIITPGDRVQWFVDRAATAKLAERRL